MNNERRKQLKSWVEKAKVLKFQLEQIESEEEEAFDNMPEGLQSSYRGMCSEDAIDSMEEASEKLDEAIELLSDIV